MTKNQVSLNGGSTWQTVSTNIADKSLAVFAIGGGGGADACSPGASGFFKYQTLSNLPASGTVQLGITIGAGGPSGSGCDESGNSALNGLLTTVLRDGAQVVTAQGGGGAGLPGWSGVVSDDGGTNGQYGTGETLPVLCGGMALAPGAAGVSSDGSGAGGVIVNGTKPTRGSSVDGEGFGAGGGEDRRPGYEGVVVVMVCQPSEPPMFIVKTSSSLTLDVTNNQVSLNGGSTWQTVSTNIADKSLAVFAIGGGGGADACSPGASGFFKYQTLSNLPASGTVQLGITIGAGGPSGSGCDESGNSALNGLLTTVLRDGAQVVTAQGGGGAGLPGWSGVVSDDGGTNGQYGTGETLPVLCGGMALAPGAAGVSSDGSGAGGVIVNGTKPTRGSSVDGEGFGAGGGEDRRPGYEGVVVVMVCQPSLRMSGIKDGGQRKMEGKEEKEKEMKKQKLMAEKTVKSREMELENNAEE